VPDRIIIRVEPSCGDFYVRVADRRLIGFPRAADAALLAENLADVLKRHGVDLTFIPVPSAMQEPAMTGGRLAPQAPKPLKNPGGGISSNSQEAVKHAR